MAALAILPGPVAADTLVLTSGRTLTGAVVSENLSEITIRTEIGTLKVRRSEVREWQRGDSSPEEVDADNSARAGRYPEAMAGYASALKKAPKGSAAASRLEGKITQLRGRTRQVEDAANSAQIQRAREMMAREDFEGAQGALEQVRTRLVTDDATSSVLRLLAEVHFLKAKQAEDRQDSLLRERELRAAVEAYPQFYKARLVYGELLLRNAATAPKGLESIQLGLKYGEGEMTDAERVQYHYIVARRYFDRGDYQSAAANFAACLRAKKLPAAYSDALDRAVESYIKMGEQASITDSQKTINNLNEALKLNPTNKSALFLLGRIHMDSGETTLAIENLKKVVEIDDKYQSVHHVLAGAYQNANDYDNALGQLDKELTNNPNNYDALTDRAEISVLQGSFEKADKDVQAAIQKEPGKWRAYLLQARINMANEQYDKAIESLDRALAIKQDAVEVYIQRGKVLAAEKKLDEARKWFEEVVKHLGAARNLTFKYKNLMAETQTALGDIAMAEDNPRSAETRFRLALDYVPNFGLALNRIGDVRRRLGAEATDADMKQDRYREALDYYNRAIAINPNNADFYLSLGILYHKHLKDASKAIVNYQKYLDLNGRDKTNVANWIKECGTPVGLADKMSTGTGTTTATAGMTTGTAGMTTGTVTTANATTAPK